MNQPFKKVGIKWVDDINNIVKDLISFMTFYRIIPTNRAKYPLAIKKLNK